MKLPTWGYTGIAAILLGAACAQPAPAPTAAPQPGPTAAPTSVSTPRATLPPAPAATLALTLAPTATATPAPTATATPRPTATVTATATPAPTAVTTPRPAEQALELRTFSFQPASVTVKVGTTLVWTNRDSTAHTVTSTATPTGVSSFDSGLLVPGQTFRLTVNQVGSYTYVCTIHPAMTGEVTVVTELAVTPNPTPIPPTPTPTPVPAVQGVDLRNFAFQPASLTAKVGTAVIWTNRDTATTHTVTSTATPEGASGFDSGELLNGQTFRLTLGKVGRYTYQCILHPSMTGEIIVIP
ncbi:MAG: cupredoxin domain-containing protein [Chloroflexi bacterium]|nr:cupredoxin domain-containing protein [Chloroflexota bacterium]